MRITIWNYKKDVVSVNPARFDTVSSLIKAIDMQKYPDEEFHVRVEDDDRRKEFYFDGADGIHIIAALFMKGLIDVVFDLDIPSSSGVGNYMANTPTPTDEVSL